MVKDDTSLNTISDDETEYTASASSTNLGGSPPTVCMQFSNDDNSTQTTIDSPTDIETGTCPNRIVDIKTLTIVVNENLAPCNM